MAASRGVGKTRRDLGEVTSRTILGGKRMEVRRPRSEPGMTAGS